MNATDRVVSQLNARLVRDGEYRARCPVHQGKSTTSLSIKSANDRVLIHCHSGCDIEDILAALKMSTAELFESVKQRNSARSDPAVVRRARALEGLRIWSERRLTLVCRLLRELDSDISRYVLLLTEESMDEPTSWLLANVYKLRSDLEWEFTILNGQSTQAKLDLWRRCR